MTMPFHIHGTQWGVTSWPSPMGLQGHKGVETLNFMDAKLNGLTAYRIWQVVLHTQSFTGQFERVKSYHILNY